MTDPVLVLDSTVLVVYKRDLTCRAHAVVLETLADGHLIVTAASPGVSTSGRTT